MPSPPKGRLASPPRATTTGARPLAPLAPHAPSPAPVPAGGAAGADVSAEDTLFVTASISKTVVALVPSSNPLQLSQRACATAAVAQ